MYNKETKLLVEAFRLFLKEAPKKSKSDDTQMGLDFSAKPKPEPKAAPAVDSNKVAIVDFDGTLWSSSLPSDYFHKSTAAWFKEGSPVKNGVDAVKKLQADGYKIIILSAHPTMLPKYRDASSYPKESAIINSLETKGVTDDYKVIEGEIARVAKELGINASAVIADSNKGQNEKVYKKAKAAELVANYGLASKDVVVVDDNNLAYNYLLVAGLDEKKVRKISI